MTTLYISNGVNHYELLAIVAGTVSDAELDSVRLSVEGILQKYTSTIHYIHNLGRRKLAYTIKHQGHGTYFLCEFDANPTDIKKLERQLLLETEILRHCIVRRKSIGAPIQLERREEESRPSRRTSPRKAMGEELLGATPLAEERVAPPTPAPVPAIQTEAPDAQPTAPTEEAPGAEEPQKKKEQKASYEELDKRLNELLSDDII